MSSLAFANATKRNRPLLQQGDLVYGQITRADAFAEPEMSCASRSISGFGALRDGALFDLNIALCRELLLSDALQEIGRALRYKAAVGINGKVWIWTDEPKQTILVWERICSLGSADKWRAVQ